MAGRLFRISDEISRAFSRPLDAPLSLDLAGSGESAYHEAPSQGSRSYFKARWDEAMYRRSAIASTLILAFAWSLMGWSIQADDRPRPSILVHEMPWFEANGFGATWGWHWTMNHFRPDQTQSDGRREVASHFYPEIGPYDSLDPVVLEYHTLLMKVAGIDGAIIDWFGNEDFNDYASIHRRTIALIEALKHRGLKFAICYEDRVVKAMAERDKLSPEAAVEHATTHLRFAENHWFRDPAYVTWDGKPLLLVFGPDYLAPAQWETIFKKFRLAPAFFSLHERKPPAIGSFAWPPMWASKAGKLDPADLAAYLDRFERQNGPKIPCAFPGFHDIYAEAKVQPSYGFLDPREGQTFRQTLDRALKLASPVVQVATWNDFGEGTCIEPTHEFGSRYLAMIQDARRSMGGLVFPYATADLRLPAKIYHLRRVHKPGSPASQVINEAVARIDAGDARRASALIDRLDPPNGPASSRRN